MPLLTELFHFANGGLQVCRAYGATYLVVLDNRAGAKQRLGCGKNQTRIIMQAVQVMSDFQATALVVGLIVGFFTVLTLRQKKFKKSRRATSEDFRKRQCNPDFEAYRRYFGCEPPAALKQLFNDPELFSNDRDMFEIEVSGKKWFVAWIDAIDEEHLKSCQWPGTQGFYAFANNGAGDQYLIDPKQEDPEVFYYEPETGKKKSVGVALSQFVSAKRIYDEE